MFTFLRVPEIHDGFEYKLFISESTTVNDSIDLIMEELGLTKSLPIPGGGNLEYVVEEVWIDGHSESMSVLVLSCTTKLILAIRILEAPAHFPRIKPHWAPILCKPIHTLSEAEVQDLCSRRMVPSFNVSQYVPGVFGAIGVYYQTAHVTARV